MPRKRKPETSGKRWKRQRRAKEKSAAFAGSISRVDCDSLEFASLFLVAGGRKKIGDDIIARAYDQYGRKMVRAIVPRILDIERDKASILMAKARDAATIQALRQELAILREQKQIAEILDAHRKKRLRWVRVNSDLECGRRCKSVLVGTSDYQGDPTMAWENLVVCFRGEDGRYHVGEETFRGEYSSPDKDGVRSQIGVTFSPLCDADGKEITFGDENEAQRTVLYRIEQRQIERLESRPTPKIHKRMEGKLRLWKTRKDAFLRDGEVRPREDWDFSHTIEVSESQKLQEKLDSLTEIQLAQNRADS